MENLERKAGTKFNKEKPIGKIDYLLMAAFVLAIFMALAGAVVSSGFFNFR